MASKAKLSNMNKQLKEEAPKQKTKKRKAIEANVPRGERANFLKITVTMGMDMLVELKQLGLKRKAAGLKDTDVSSLVREAISEMLHKKSGDY